MNKGDSGEPPDPTVRTHSFDTPAVTIGDTFSHYRILEKLGEGGMGVVYKAEDTKLKRVVALKFLCREAVAFPDAKARLLHEAQAAAALDHPNICTVHEIGEEAGQTFIVMAFVEGEDVKERTTRGPLPLGDAIDIAKQAATGLKEAHRKGIVHRDIKPANLMVSATGQVTIMDFGVARAVGQTKLTRTGTPVGTVAYMSPEQARGEPSDHRTDIWSFGVLLYEMITGRLPFRGGHEHTVLHSVLYEDPDPVTAVRTDVPVELERVVEKAMAKRPEDRYQHLDDILVDLNAVENQLEEAGGTRPVSRTVNPSPARGGGRKRLAIGMGAAVLVAAAVAIGLVLSHQLRDSGGRVATSGGQGGIQSLAVLPFQNLMDDPEQDYFVDGMHEALITGLSKMGSLRVISRTSVMRYRGTELPLPEIARELDVDALVEGSVLRVGDEVRVTAQLIDGKSDEHVWADSYDRDLRNVLSLFNEVAGAIAEEIDARLTPEQEERLARARPVDLDAYDEMLRGSQLFNTFRWKKVHESIAHFEKAIEIDPGFAEAHAWLAGAYVVLSILGSPPMDVLPKAKRAAAEALAIDEDLAVAHTSMGYVLLYFDRDWEGGSRAFRRALEIDPNDAMARHGYADYLVAMGLLDDSVDQVLRGRKSNPLSRMANAVVVGHLYIARRYDEMIAEAEKLLEVDADFLAVRNFLRRAYWQMGKREESLAMLRETAWANEPMVKKALDRGYAEGGARGAMSAVAELLEAQSDTGSGDPLVIALYYGRADRGLEALTWLERAMEDRSPTLVHVLLDPCFDSVRDTPRFKALRHRMNLPD